MEQVKVTVMNLNTGELKSAVRKVVDGRIGYVIDGFLTAADSWKEVDVQLPEE